MVNEFSLAHEMKRARSYSVALRHLLGTGLEPATYSPELWEWSGPLLPLDGIDRRASTGTQRRTHRLAS